MAKLTQAIIINDFAAIIAYFFKVLKWSLDQVSGVGLDLYPHIYMWTGKRISIAFRKSSRAKLVIHGQMGMSICA